MMHELQTVAFGFGLDHRNVIYVETTHEELCSRLHTTYILFHVVQQDIPVDVGNDYIEWSLSFQ